MTGKNLNNKESNCSISFHILNNSGEYFRDEANSDNKEVVYEFVSE